MSRKCVLLLSAVGLASMVWGAATSDFAGVWMTRAGTDVWTGFRLVQEKIRSCNADDCVGGGRK